MSARRMRAVPLVVIAIGGLLASCTTAPPPALSRSFRIGVATFSHETCTFCPNPTGVAEWEFYGPPVRGEALLEEGGYIGGFVKAAKEYSDLQLVGLLSPRDAKGGSSGSWITRDAFDKYTNGFVEDLKAQGPVDGVYLALHGAMAVTGVPKPEAEIVRRVRKAVGQAPIVVTFDLHANEDEELLAAADGAFIVKRYPHYDAALQGERALRYLLRVIKGTYTPAKATRKPGVITPSVVQGTGVSPAMEIMERARVWEERTPDAFVSVAFGFAYADVPDVGATVMVMTNGDQALADRIADDMSAFIWRHRETFAGRKLPKVREGVSEALAAAKAGRTPVVVADHADRTGNSTWILEELIRQDGRNAVVATIADDRAIADLKGKAAVGSPVRVQVGGYADEYAGRPVTIEGTLEYLGKYGDHTTVAVIRFGRNNRVVLTPVLHQVMTPGIIDDLGIGWKNCDLIVIKSRVHFWRGFVEDGFAKAVVVVDAPGLGPADLTGIPYKNIPNNLYPLHRKD